MGKPDSSLSLETQKCIVAQGYTSVGEALLRVVSYTKPPCYVCEKSEVQCSWTV